MAPGKRLLVTEFVTPITMIAQAGTAAWGYKMAREPASNSEAQARVRTAGMQQIALKGLSVWALVLLETVITSVTPIIQIARLKDRHVLHFRAPITGCVSLSVAQAVAVLEPVVITTEAAPVAAAIPVVAAAAVETLAVPLAELPVVLAIPLISATLPETVAHSENAMWSACRVLVMSPTHVTTTAPVMWSALKHPVTVTVVSVIRLSPATLIVSATPSVVARVVAPVALMPTAEWAYCFFCWDFWAFGDCA